MKKYIFFAFLLTGFMACQSDGNGGAADSPEIIKLEQEVAEKMTSENAKALIAAYQNAIADASDEKAAEYYYKMAELQYRQNRYSGAVKSLKDALKNHYSAAKTPENARFLAQIYKDKLKNETAAAAIYQLFIKAFPKNEKTAAIAADYGAEPSMDEKIVDFGNRLMNDSTNRIDYRVANDFMGLCEIHALMMPKDEKSAEYLHKAGETARSLRSFPKALEFYNWITDRYPDSPKAPQALFLKAFTYDNDLKKPEEAKKLYEEFLQKYPNDDFADDTEFLLKNLGKDDEEIINSFGK